MDRVWGWGFCMDEVFIDVFIWLMGCFVYMKMVFLWLELVIFFEVDKDVCIFNVISYLNGCCVDIFKNFVKNYSFWKKFFGFDVKFSGNKYVEILEI